MGNRQIKLLNLDGEERVKGYGLLVYGGMATIAGAILAERSPAFILLASLGLVALIVGLGTLVHLALRKWTSREHLSK